MYLANLLSLPFELSAISFQLSAISFIRFRCGLRPLAGLLPAFKSIHGCRLSASWPL